MKQQRWYSPRIAANLRRAYTRATPEDIIEGLTWYQRAHNQCESLATKYGVTTQAACGVMAALSPGSAWERNVADCDTFLDEWTHGARGKRLPLVGSYGWRNIVKASKIAGGQDPLKVLGGPKVRAFYQCIFDPSNSEYVCIDRHAKSAALGEKLTDKDSVVRPAQYQRFAKHYMQGARNNGILPNQFQAVIWTVWRRLGGNLNQQDLWEVPF